MEDLPVYFDDDVGIYRLMTQGDHGLGELAFSSEVSYFDGSDVSTQTDVKPSINQLYSYEVLDEEDDNEFEDDVQDTDYLPSRPRLQTKKVNMGRGRSRPFGIYPMLSATVLSPTKSKGSKSDNELDRQGRKDRTPRTILKMMERHRESERVRHHSLNESMREICGYVPGYDPDVKETKVIQMQRIIGYECFLENTVSNLCEQLGLKPRNIGINTHFITEAVKHKDEVQRWQEGMKLPCRVPIVSANSRYSMKSGPYRREKISSPTVDSTTDNFQVVHVYPRPGGSVEDCGMPTQSFLPIQAPETTLPNGIKVEVQPTSTCTEEFLAGDLGCLLDQSLCSEPESLKSVTATFMRDDLSVPTSTFTEEECSGGFDLSSPVRHSHKVFLQSPKARGTWQHPDSLHYTDKSDNLASTEMASISPEFILETKPKEVTPSELGCSFEAVSYTPQKSDVYTSENFSQESVLNSVSGSVTPSKPQTLTTVTIFTPYPIKYETVGSVQGLGPCYQQATYVSQGTGERNKRKRYLPHRAPLAHLENRTEVGSVQTETEQSFPSHAPQEKRRKTFPGQEKNAAAEQMGESRLMGNSRQNAETRCTSNHNYDTRPKGCDTRPSRCSPRLNHTDSRSSGRWQNSSEEKENEQEQGGSGNYSLSPLDSPGQLSSQSSERIDMRRASWMNGFMMFSQLNRKRFIEANPGVHTSHISKMMGHVWRNMSSQDQLPYREKAKKYSSYIRDAYNKDFFSDDCLEPSSTTDGDMRESSQAVQQIL